MKIAMAVLLFVLMLCGCSRKEAGPAMPAIDRVQAGQDIKWAGGYVLHVEKRDGAALEGIKVAYTNGIMTADSGTISPGSPKDSSDTNSVTIVLKDARAVITNKDSSFAISTFEKFPIVLHE